MSVAGEWLGEQLVTDVSGGECVAPAFEDLWQLPSQFRASVTQLGSTLTAVMNIDHTGATCTYSGTIEGNSIALTMTSCTDSKLRGIACADGALRDVLHKSQTIHATVTVDAISGTDVEGDIVVAAGGSDTLAALVATSSFSMQRR